MARLINTDKPAMAAHEEKKGIGGRKLSFKTRGGGSGGPRTCRATKVSVPSNSVQEIASKFNAIIVEDESKGRALLKKLQSSKSPVGSSVREAVLKFENVSEKQREKPKLKMVLVRKNSQPKLRKLHKVKEETEPIKLKPVVKPKPKPDIDKCHLNRKPPLKIITPEVTKDKRLSIPKNDILDSVLNETPTEPTDENVPNGRISYPNSIQEGVSKLFEEEKVSNSVFPENNSVCKIEAISTANSSGKLSNAPVNRVVQNVRPNSSFLWRAKETKDEDNKMPPAAPVENISEAKKPETIVEEEIQIPSEEEKKIVKSTEKTPFRYSLNLDKEDKENVKSFDVPCIERTNTTLLPPKEEDYVRKLEKKGYGKINQELKANISSLYRHLSTSKEQVSILQENNSYIHQQPPPPASDSAYEDIGKDPYEEVENNYDVINYGGTDDDAIYDDVLNVQDSNQNTNHCEGIYESIYDAGINLGSDSSYEQSNSLYEARPSSRASSGSGAIISGASRSDTSDDWVDIEVDISEETKVELLVLQDTSKTKYPGDSWSQNVRKQWNSKLLVENQGESDSSGIHYEVVDSPYDVCDDFDDSSESELSVENGYSPQHQMQNGEVREDQSSSQNDGIYGFMRTARKKMRKTSWSFGQRLKRISRISMAVPVPAAAEQITNGSPTEISRGKWPSFKKKNPTSNSTFYLDTISLASSKSMNGKERVPKQNQMPNKDNTPVPSRAPNVDVRRLSTSIRPTSPPPPPPPLIANFNGDSKSKPINDTSLYMECGLFENSSTDRGKSATNSWYSDAGLYENSKPTDSASEHDSSNGSELDLKFANEPLYQFYAACVAELERVDTGSEVGYEEIKRNENIFKSNLNNRPSALDLVNSEKHRTLWSQVPQVINSGILDTLSPEKKRLQEAKFELITSEASYYKSLSVLEKHFAASPFFKEEGTISKVDYKTLFGNITPVQKCSEAVLAALEKCWQESILLEGVCDIICQLTQDKFSCYVKYCQHQVAIERTLKNLKKSNPAFLEALNTLESSPKCHSLSLYSFLLLPMQRITRMPLLLDAILTKLVPSDTEYDSCKTALTKLSKVVHDCNEAARQTERLEEMVRLSRSLIFPSQVRRLPLLSESRWLVRSGQVTHINLEPKLTLSKKLTSGRSSNKLTLFLFTDYLILAKKKGEDNHMVVTYCSRKFVQMTSFEDPIASSKFLILLTLLENHEGKTQELVVSCGSESSKERWLHAFTTPKSKDPNEVLYESWDCPQVSAIHAYSSTQPDELTLQPGDVINVHRKSDGWYYGERTRDREEGWFPGNHTVEIASSHIRARNLKQRHRLLAFSSTFILNKQNKVS